MALFVLPEQQTLDLNGDVGSGWKLNFYQPGTSTRKSTYSDSGLTTAHANPVVADSSGRFDPIYTFGKYKVVLTNAADVVQFTVDNWEGNGGSAHAVASLTVVQGLAGAAADDLVYMKGRATTGDGAEGTFIWRTGDKSTEVAADEVTSAQGNGGIWIAPASDKTGASGAWERLRKIPYNVKFVGTPTDGTDVSATLTAARSASKTLLFPAGTYTFTADSTDLFDDETTLILEDGAILYSAAGVQVRGNMAVVSGSYTKHFDHPDYTTQWATSTSYTAGDIVQFEYGRYYKAAVTHTSGTWTTDKAAGKFVSFAPFQFFQRSERDAFVYPEWFGAKPDSSTLCSIPFANAVSCNSVFASLNLFDSSGTTTNGYYRLTRPLVLLNGRTLSGGKVDRAFPLLRIDGASWEGGNLGISSEEWSSSPGNLSGYSSWKNLRFQIEGMSNTSFEWFKSYFLETACAEHITWEFIGVNSIKQEAQFSGGPARISDLNIVYGDNGTVADYPLYFNMFNGCVVRNINYKNQSAVKGLKIRAGRFTDISGIYLETPPTDVSEPYLLIEQGSDSNGRIGEIFITNNKSGDTAGLALEVTSNASLSSFISNVNIENIKIFPHDGVGSAIDDIIKINGITWTRSQLQDATGSTHISISRINQHEFLLAGTRQQHSDGPVRSSWHFSSIANGATESIHFAPILRQGAAADTFQSWAGLVMISARGATDKSYCAFVGLQQGSAGVYSSTITELAGAANFSIAWNSTNFEWDITNDTGGTVNQVIISFINQGPNIFTK